MLRVQRLVRPGNPHPQYSCQQAECQLASGPTALGALGWSRGGEGRQRSGRGGRHPACSASSPHVLMPALMQVRLLERRDTAVNAPQHAVRVRLYRAASLGTCCGH
jgi:hypothetical protein